MLSMRMLAVNTVVLAVAWFLAGCDNVAIHAGPAPEQAGKAAVEKSITFDDFDLNKTPPGFLTALTGGGGPVSWVVLEDPTAPSGKRVLAQTSRDETDYRFPICVFDGISAKDVEVGVRFKTVSGKVDQAAGVIVRYKDKDNYYVVRANALEDNVRFYKVESGKRSQLAGINTKVSPGQWHELKLTAKGTHFTVTFEGKGVEADDSTFPDAGKAGLWTKADSVTHFDNLKIESYDKR